MSPICIILILGAVKNCIIKRGKNKRIFKKKGTIDKCNIIYKGKVIMILTGICWLFIL